jgi:hypothetical protein
MPLTPEEFQRRVEKTFEYDRLVRSHAIYEAMSAEDQIQNIIAKHFCPDQNKHLSFIAWLFVSTEVGFRKKLKFWRRY